MSYERVLRVANFCQYKRQEPDVKHVIELEGKTKHLLCDLPVECDGHRSDLVLIPQFQGAWMKVRITVELLPAEEHFGRGE